MRRSIWAAGAAAVLALVAGGVVEAQPRGRGGPLGRGGMFGPMRLLDLSDEQQAAFREAADKHREAVEPLRRQHQDLRRQMREALEKGGEAARVGQLAIEAHRMGERLRAERSKLEESLAALLNAEQRVLWDKMKAVREKDRGRVEEGRGPGEGFGPGRRGPRGPRS
jgi:Spy/CpxP family protein refolding chaperone